MLAIFKWRTQEKREGISAKRRSRQLKQHSAASGFSSTKNTFRGLRNPSLLVQSRAATRMRAAPHSHMSRFDCRKKKDPWRFCVRRPFDSSPPHNSRPSKRDAWTWKFLHSIKEKPDQVEDQNIPNDVVFLALVLSPFIFLSLFLYRISCLIPCFCGKDGRMQRYRVPKKNLKKKGDH